MCSMVKNPARDSVEVGPALVPSLVRLLVEGLDPYAALSCPSLAPIYLQPRTMAIASTKRDRTSQADWDVT